MWSQTFICERIFARKNIFQMIFDIGIFGGGEESSSFTQERFTDHEGGRSLSLVFQFTSHLLTFSKYVFFTHQPLFARQVLLDYFIFYCCVRQNKANSWKGIWQWGQFQTIKEIIWYCQQPKVATFHCFFSFFRNLTLMKPLWLISPSISLIGDSSWFLCFTLKLWSIFIFF